MGRLFWRPASLGLLFMVTLAAVGSLTLPAWGESIMSNAESPAGLLSGPVLWRLALVLPVAVGVVSSMIVNEARHTASAWTLPGFGAGLLSGTAATAAVTAALIGTLATTTRGFFPGIAAFGVAALCFSLGAFVADPLTPKIQSRITLLALAGLAIRPEYLQRFAEWQPLPLAVPAALIAFVLLRRGFSAELGRRRPFVAALALISTSSSSARAYWAGKPLGDSEWKLPLRNGSVSNWVRAAHYETFGARSRGFFTFTLFNVLFIGVFAYYVGEPDMVVFIPAIGATMGTFHLGGRFLYPLARSERARITYVASLLQITTIFALSAVALTAMYALGVSVEPGRRPQTLANTIPLVLFFMAWAPLGQLGNIRGRPMDEMFVSVRQGLTVFALMMAWMAGALRSHDAYAEAELFAELPYATRLALIGVLIAITQTAYWYALRWYYAHRDIVFTPSR